MTVVGYDFYHGNDEPGAPRVFHASRTFSEHGIVTLPYLNNLDRIEGARCTLVALPLKLVGADASPGAWEKSFRLTARGRRNPKRDRGIGVRLIGARCRR